MNKKSKKLLCAALSLSMIAGSIAVPLSASADEIASNSITISGDGSQATVKAAEDAVAIVAEYAEDGRLTKVNSEAVSANEEKTLSVQIGDKVMLWSKVGKNPLTEAVKAYATGLATPEPTATPETGGVTVIKSWKFDMGSAEDTDEGWTAVTTDMNYTFNKVGDDQYGFIGTNENDYKLAGGRIDGFEQQAGQVIELTAANDAIGSTGADDFGNAGDKYYPVRFAMKVPDDTYYRVKATVTTLDPTKPATASLYTERKHPLYTEKTIEAGEKITTEFRVRVTPIYYEKSDPKGTAADEVVNVAVLGENTALESVEIDQIETTPTLWVIGDSTVTDGGGTLPFTPYAQCTGVGTGLTKYLPSEIAMVNVGEGGLNAADNNHLNIAKNRIKAGDYMYVEYGHNHKTDGVEGYKTHLDKYYDACKAVGATLILVGPIDRHNDSQYTAETNTWASTLSGYSDAAKEYVDAKIAEGATDIAFVDLNKPCLDWLTTLTAGGTVNDTEYTNDIRFTNYYFATGKDGATDGTHPNDAGAENLAYFFFSTADTESYPALAPLMTEYTKEAPTPVSAEVINKGWAGKSDVWPNYIVMNLPALPVVVDGIEFAEDGSVASVDVTVRKAKLEMDAYGIIVVTIKDENGTEIGKLYAKDQVDNSTGEGAQTIVNFKGDAKLPENGSYEVQVWKAIDDGEQGLIVDPENVAYSAVLKPTEIENYLITGDETDVETFNYFGADKLTDATEWKSGGSASMDLTLGTDDNGVTYTKICSDGAKNGSAGQGSFYIMRALENIGSGTSYHGRYMISVDAKYVSGEGLNFALAKTTTPTKSPFVADQFTAFTIGSNGNVTIAGAEDAVGQISPLEWTNVTYILDMDAGTAEISVGGGIPVTVPVAMYQTFGTPAIDNLAHFIMEGQKIAFNVDITNLIVAKLKDTNATTTISAAVAEDCAGMGTAYIEEAGKTEATVAQSSVVKAVAAPADGYVFTGWMVNGELFSSETEVSVRVYKDIALTATFAKQGGVENVANFSLAADKTRMAVGTEQTVTMTVSNVVDAASNVVEYDPATDIAWSCDDDTITVANGVVTIPETYTSDEFKKTVTVTATINGINKNVQLKLYSCNEYEDFSEISNFSEWISDEGCSNSSFAIVNTASDTETFTGMTSAGNGNVLVMGSTLNGSGKYLAYERDMGLSEKSVLKFGFEIEPHQIRNDGKNAAVTLQFVDSDGTKVFDISVNTAGKNSSFNGTAVNGFVKGTAIAVDTVLDFENATMDYVITNAEGNVLATGTTALTAKNLAKMNFKGDWQYGKFALDNVYAVYAD